jgi:hypothetical protein
MGLRTKRTPIASARRAPSRWGAQEAVPVLELFGEQVGLDAFKARYAGDYVKQDHDAHGADNRSSAVAGAGGQQHPDAGHREQWNQVAGVGGDHEQEAFGGRDGAARERRDRVETPRGDAADGRDRGRQEHRDRGVGDCGQGLGGEHLAAVYRAREDRLECAVAVLGGDHIAGHQGGDQRQEEDGLEQQHQHRRGQTRLSDLAGEDTVAAAVACVHVLHDHEDQGQDHGQAEAHVGALLGTQLAQLPAVDGERGRAPRARCRGRGQGRGSGDAAHQGAPATRGPTGGREGVDERSLMALPPGRRRAVAFRLWALTAWLRCSRSNGRTGPQAWPARA